LKDEKEEMEDIQDIYRKRQMAIDLRKEKIRKLNCM